LSKIKSLEKTEIKSNEAKDKFTFKGFGKSREKKRDINEAIRKSFQDPSSVDKEEEKKEVEEIKSSSFDNDREGLINEKLKDFDMDESIKIEPEKVVEEKKDVDEDKQYSHESKSFNDDEEDEKKVTPAKKEVTAEDYEDISYVEENNSVNTSNEQVFTQQNKQVKEEKSIELNSKGALSEEQEEILEIVKSCLNKEKTTINDLIENEVIDIENGIRLSELISLLSPICHADLSYRQKNQLEGIFTTIANNEYISINDLKRMFESKNKAIEKHSKDAVGIIKAIADYLDDYGIMLIDLTNEIIYEKKESMDNKAASIKLIKTKDFYDLLKKSNIVKQENEGLTKLLCIDNDTDKISFDKLETLIKQVKD